MSRCSRGNAAAGRAAGLDGLDFAAVGRAAAHFLDDLPQRRAHRHFDEAGVVDFSGERKNFGALAFFRADAGEPVRALAMNRRHVGEGLDVVDQRGAAPQSAFRRERRARTRRAALAFDGGHQRGFLAANERAGADADVYVEIERRFKNAAAEQAELSWPV